MRGSSTPSSASPGTTATWFPSSARASTGSSSTNTSSSRSTSAAWASSLGRDARLSEYLFALGGVRFCAIRRALHGIEVRLDDLHRILRGGLFPGMRFDPAAVFDTPAQPLPVALEESARDRLLRRGPAPDRRAGLLRDEHPRDHQRRRALRRARSTPTSRPRMPSTRSSSGWSAGRCARSSPATSSLPVTRTQPARARAARPVAVAHLPVPRPQLLRDRPRGGVRAARGGARLLRTRS